MRLSRIRGGVGRLEGKVAWCFCWWIWVRFAMIEGHRVDSPMFAFVVFALFGCW